MGQQAWKNGVSSSVVGSANKGLGSGVGTASLLSLFEKEGGGVIESKAFSGKGQKWSAEEKEDEQVAQDERRRLEEVQAEALLFRPL